MKFIFYILLIYILYKILVDFIIPVSKVTSRVRKQMKNMQQEQESASAQQNFSSAETKAPSETQEGEYIEFEEIKHS